MCTMRCNELSLVVITVPFIDSSRGRGSRTGMRCIDA
jgi:hypothetical protein